MKRFLPLCLAAGVMVACDYRAAPTEPPDVLRIARFGPEPSVSGIRAAPARNDNRTQVVRADETRTFFDPCFGEEVLVEFHRQFVFFFRYDAAGDVHLRFNVIQQRSTVTGLVTGTVWRLHGTEIFGGQGDISSPTTPGTFTFLLSHTLTSPGQAVNQRLRERVHLTINANETVTVERAYSWAFASNLLGAELPPHRESAAAWQRRRTS